MSLDCDSFLCENGTTGFLGGIISAASDEFNAQMYNLGIRYEDFEVDIFYIGENNEITFEDAIKKRMNNSWYGASSEGDTTDINKLVDSTHFKFEKTCEKKLLETIIKMYKYDETVNLNKINVLAKEIETTIEYYLQKPKAIYDLPFANNSKIYEVNSIISRCYTCIIFNVMLAEYDRYIILLVRGSNE
ncbi:hypothetical protein [Clostridium beijerinckii]|jgi:hypothetical protein|uniref:Uncharacterized protein n=2 Tax=Clostridium beijerinckii TaxID=1520 RepID=A0AAE2RUY3_CLOBE|nr:hypothetical protein [Clostridium beijerinckii]ABR35318.1 hypothetical protein Cbei_3188 [Clostridium beijerinckii NCIMB 8052]AIU05054.1 hypothetical protein Cbs_3188 [Clostridium beijerinckii ATCC 35702]MBF7810044.1 hypothetical protein [Clostridium beijerinckii]NOW90628.1 hypothetical protein [Clostridium beijerinckii]NRT23277.1 hypothetical protein [Clostridium beijerinckii]